MNVEILQNGRVLDRIDHSGQSYIEAPPSGEYEIRLVNNAPKRRLAVVSVDGINVIDGKDAGFSGPGYVLEPWASQTIKGFLRSSEECARFTFSPSDGSYANQTGRGKKNVGIIGVAVFDEVEKPVTFVPPVVIERIVERRPWGRPWMPWVPPQSPPWQAPQSPFWWDHQITCSTTPLSHSEPATASYSAKGQPATKSLSRSSKGASRRIDKGADAEVDLGTAYGKAEAFYTQKAEFLRASSAPALLVTLRYATKKKLLSWGVPVDRKVSSGPSAFPVEQGFAAPPPGWSR